MAILFATVPSITWAGSGCITIFTTIYPASESYARGSCQTCHESPGGGSNYNLYGADLRANGANGAGFNCTGADFELALRAVEALDSDAEGHSNLAEIEAGTQPGWCDVALFPGCANSGGTPPTGATGFLDPVDAPPANTVPVADAGGPYAGVAGETPIQFDGSGSMDADGDSLSYRWDFGDGATATGMTPMHTYLKAGTFTVSLVVNDGQDDSAAATATADISAPPVNLSPTADPGGPYSGEPGQALAFDGTASSDPNGDALTYLWEFGDGATASGATPSHSYSADGTYTATLTVSDGEFTDAATTSVNIATAPANRAPTSEPGGPYAGDVNAGITFDGTASSDPDGDTLNFTWDFGDGSTASGATPTHSYAAAGQYDVSLTVSDGEFDAVATTTVTVSDVAERDPNAMLYDANCLGCHGDPWDGPAVDDMLPGLRRVTGARSCNIEGSIFGTSVFPGGVPEMLFLQGLKPEEISGIAEYLNAQEATGEQRYVTTCAGCHGNDGSGGRVHENVRGESAGETREAIHEESQMRYLECMPSSDIDAIVAFLQGDSDSGSTTPGDTSSDDDDESRHEESGAGSFGVFLLFSMLAAVLHARRRERRAVRVLVRPAG